LPLGYFSPDHALNLPNSAGLTEIAEALAIDGDPRPARRVVKYVGQQPGRISETLRAAGECGGSGENARVNAVLGYSWSSQMKFTFWFATTGSDVDPRWLAICRGSTCSNDQQERQLISTPSPAFIIAYWLWPGEGFKVRRLSDLGCRAAKATPTSLQVKSTGTSLGTLIGAVP
jgi:hypothetical protein